MKKNDKNFFLSLSAVILLSMLTTDVKAETVTQTATMQAAVVNIFSIEFYQDANVLYTTNIPFTNIDPARSLCYADGRSEYDGKSDTGVLCRSNLDAIWYLKMDANTSTPSFPLANFKYYMGQPWNRNTGQSADGTLAQSPDWYSVPPSPVVTYTAGTQDKNNSALGTLATLSYAVNPATLYSGVSYIINISLW